MKMVFCRVLPFLLAVICLLALPSCQKEKAIVYDGDAVKLSFKDASGYDYLKKLDGKQVVMNGYMATSSPVDGSFMFLMNLPYQSCPFCKPNTSELSNTMEVYPKRGETFTYTASAVRIVGTLQVAPSEDELFSDPYGYQFGFKIVDAAMMELSEGDISEDMKLWQKIAESDVINEIYGMYDYVNFVCCWDTYFVNSQTEPDGTVTPGYYLYAADAMNNLNQEQGQYHYGRVDGYFDGLIQKVEAVDKTAFSRLTENIRAAEALANKAYAELEAGNYTSEYRYVEQFGQSDYVYHLTKGAALTAEFEEVYADFADWLGGWEL